MDAALFYNKADYRRIDKDNFLEVIKVNNQNTFNVEFIENSSIINPRLKLSTGTDALKANYLYLKDFNRYYFIDNMIVENGYIIVECSVDVLMSFQKELIECQVVLDRNSSNYDLYLPDNEQSIEARTNIRTIEFPNGFNETAGFVLILAGSN